MTIKPLYKHDCEHCKFLGTVTINEETVDVWVCENAHNAQHTDLIWRYSSEPSDYGSVPISLVTPLSRFASTALSMYIRYLGCFETNAIIKGSFFKDGECILRIN